ncbi:hypothetical protein ACFE04_030064 [Oxalis oulophora]
MATRSLLRRTRTKLAVAATALCGGVAAAAVVSSDDPAKTIKLCTTVPVRLFRNSVTAASIAFDYQYSLLGLPEESSEKERIKREVHLRSAKKLQELCFKNKGIYIKLGQHVGQLEYLVPEEYVRTMRESMLNKCPTSSYEQVREVFNKELGETPEQMFKEFDPVPIASASLAQVHVARTHDDQKVAVKVQHIHMTDSAIIDHATVELIVNAVHWFFPSVDYRWLLAEMKESLPKEINFLVEAKNSEIVIDNFRKQSPHIADYVYAPKVYWNLSTPKLLIMEFIDGPQVDDVKAIKKLGIRPEEVAKLVSQAFAEMIFKHGFVHVDPHAANLLVRPLPSSRGNLLGKKKPQLVLLDHGLYKELDVATRFHYASLWKGLIFSDAKAIRENSVKLGAGEDLYTLFAGVLTMRPWKRVIDPAADHLVINGSDSERAELQMYASEHFPQISELLRRLPRVIVMMLKTNDCLRSVNNALLNGSSLELFLITGRVSSEALIQAKKLQKKSLLSWLDIWWEELLLEARLFGMKVALWLMQFRNTLTL